ncbi:hypothetical protein [Pseudogulbenkiania subflava]|uniref:Uncharacterized protein n=1 Tax=Pseudogulbenkiania subflava DSM 22618 TaxID=1123014 RepID=A0A1Y6CFA8_9NEIS|nr:hypothetical protein [Pseudogulbenkiania subflava]SMF53287.1 hypothetical protein SAMN02745746_03805 [Pseudogulbenkiania subflava DSM 22618]
MDTAIPEQGDLFAPQQLELFQEEESPAHHAILVVTISANTADNLLNVAWHHG